MSHYESPCVGIVVVSYNTRDLLRECVHSATTAEIPAGVVVVDNASADGSAAMIQREFPYVDLIANDSNRGFAAATNHGIRHACDSWPNLEYVLLLNPDAYLRPGALGAMIDFMSRHPRVGCVGARLLYPDGRPQEGAWRFPTLLMTLFDLFPPRGPLLGRLYESSLNGRYREEHDSQPFPIDHPLGAAMLIRRATLDEIGLLDEGFWMYAEEVDWCYRCRKAGWAIWQVPQAEVVHHAGASSKQFRGRSFEALHRSRLRFFRKHYDSRFRRWNARIIRVGMVRSSLAAWRDWLSGRLTLDDLRARLLTYGCVLRLATDS